ncbi:MAG: Hsp70 family protein [Clostridia bacterium]|nr:Hsp70 family protein [Clostridia bacterium]
MGLIVGIDFGTTTAAVSYVDRNTLRPFAVKNGFGNSTTPTAVCFMADGVCFVEEAKDRFGTTDDAVCMFFKRHIGDEEYEFCANGRSFGAVELATLFLKHLIAEAAKSLGDKITQAVVAVPAYYTSNEREAAIKAVSDAGVKVIGLINEPTAAMLAYSLNEKSKKRVLVYDLGGGTFDVTLADVDNRSVNVLAIGGNRCIGGKDWDDCIVRLIVNELGSDAPEDAGFADYLQSVAEKVKIRLSSAESCEFSLRYGKLNRKITLTADKFAAVGEYLINSTKQIVLGVLNDKGMSMDDVDEVLLVGGATRMKAVEKMLGRMFRAKISHAVDPDEAVALGAALYADVAEDGRFIGADEEKEKLRLTGRVRVQDVTAHALGLIAKSADKKSFINSVIIEKNTPIPVFKKALYTYNTKSDGNILEIYLLQGDNPRPLDNEIVKKYSLTDISPVSYGETVIEVTYGYTESGTVTVTAKQLELDKELTVTRDRVEEDMSWTDDVADKIQSADTYIKSVRAVFAVDVSGSMRRPVKFGEPSPLAQIKECVKKYIRGMEEYDYASVGIVAFADGAECVQPITDDLIQAEEAVDRIDAFHLGGTNNAQPFSKICEMFGGIPTKIPSVKYAIVLTDGEWKKQAEAIAEAKRCADADVEIMTVGFGNANADFLRKIAGTDSLATIVHLSEVKETFDRIAIEIRGRYDSLDVPT